MLIYPDTEQSVINSAAADQIFDKKTTLVR